MTTAPAMEILLLHVALALAALAVVGSARWWIRRGANRHLPARPVEVAYLNDGHRLVVFTGLAALRRHGMIRLAPSASPRLPAPLFRITPRGCTRRC